MLNYKDVIFYKIRIWDKQRKQMLYPKDLKGNYKMENSSFFQKKHIIPMLYTGLKSNNDKDVYEADKVKWTWVFKDGSETILHGVIRYTQLHFYFEDNYDNTYARLEGMISSEPQENDKIEIIGNIYEKD